MPRVHTKQELASTALAVSASLTLVQYKGHLYEARDFETGEADPPPERTIWVEQTSDDLMDIAQAMGILFTNQNEFMSFKYMVRQGANRRATAEPYVMIPHGDGLAYMTDHGLRMVDQTPAFSPNFINYQIIDKDDEKHEEVKELFRTISEWVGGDDQARSLLHHLATALQPGWSAVKYLILLGAGRNGKGTLIKMLAKLLGKRNISGVFRQDMAARKAIINALNGKLANIIYDGPQSYVGESGPEKTLVAGEPIDIEMKFENEALTVETNCLFIEALNKEPKSRDKSPALQARLVRFSFPNKFAKDLNFEAHMQSEDMLNAFLTLLWEHWVCEDELATKLQITDQSLDLQTANEMNRSPVLAFIEDMQRKDPTLIEALESGTYKAETLFDALQPWMQTQGYEDRNASAVWDHIADHFVVERVVKRVKGRPVSQRILTSPNVETVRALRAMGGESADDRAMVREELTV